MLRLAIIIALATACSHAKQEGDKVAGKEFNGDLPAAEDLSGQDAHAATFEGDAVDVYRDDGGFVVGHKEDGSPDGDGDGALRTSLIMLSLSCEKGAPLLAVLIKDIHDNGGLIDRHNPDVPSANGRSTRDQVTGVALAFVDRWQRCPDDRPTIKEAWTEHVAYVEATGALAPTLDGALLTFRWLWGAVGQYFAAGGGGGSKQEWEAGGAATAESIKTKHDACYPVHIETLQSILAVKIGQPKSRLARGSFCEASNGLGLQLTDWYCERAKALPWLQAFKPSVWQLEFQRCQAWENPDAAPGKWPATDFLEQYVLAK